MSSERGSGEEEKKEKEGKHCLITIGSMTLP